MPKNKNIQEIYNHLSDLDKKHSLAYNKQERERIEYYTRTYANSYIDDDVYTHMSEGKASGLFACGHYDFDMEQSLRILKDMLHNKD